jgi:uncharacterized repeat protein (TIGR03803 family)
MKQDLIPPTANCISTFAYWARGATMQWCLCPLALAIVLGLAAVPPSAQGQTLTVLYSFNGGADGWFPDSGVISDPAGNLYGTTLYGGDLTCDSGLGCGTVFKLDATGRETVLHGFTGGADGAYPGAGLIRDQAGNLYGTALEGGDRTCNTHGIGCGTVFKLDASGRETVLHAFTRWPDGAFPQSVLVRDARGNLYGTTLNGGSLTCDCGTVFGLNRSGQEIVLHSFTAGADGSSPQAGVIRDAAGNFFGTTFVGGAPWLGTVYKVDHNGKETVLHTFTGADGANSYADLIANGEDLYGTTSGGGAFGGGTVFKLDKTGTETVVYSFTGGVDGASPRMGLIHDAAGNLYGTTAYGGAYNFGTVFKLDSSGTETVLYNFTGGADGGTPHADLMRDAAGNLYGTTQIGGNLNAGTVFKITP